MGINQQTRNQLIFVSKKHVNIVSHFSHGDSIRANHQFPGIYRGSLEKRQKHKKCDLVFSPSRSNLVVQSFPWCGLKLSARSTIWAWFRGLFFKKQRENRGFSFLRGSKTWKQKWKLGRNRSNFGLWRFGWVEMDAGGWPGPFFRLPGLQNLEKT